MSELVAADILAELPAAIYISIQSRFAKRVPVHLGWIRALLRMHGSTKHQWSREE